MKCENAYCAKSFEKLISKISPHNYCSRHCAVSINNKKYPKNPGVIKYCALCHKSFVSREKYCSLSCNRKGKTIPPATLIKKIRDFYEAHGRIPFKREFPSARAARERFGSWNKAIEAAGFKPNPVMFANEYVAKDGHICDSLSEKIIDDWLYRKQVQHTRNVSYPGNTKLTADFLVGKYWIEFFGLFGEHRRYDELRREKLSLAKQFRLKLIAIYPQQLFPINQLENVLSHLLLVN